MPLEGARHVFKPNGVGTCCRPVFSNAKTSRSETMGWHACYVSRRQPFFYESNRGSASSPNISELVVHGHWLVPARWVRRVEPVLGWAQILTQCLWSYSGPSPSKVNLCPATGRKRVFMALRRSISTTASKVAPWSNSAESNKLKVLHLLTLLEGVPRGRQVRADPPFHLFQLIPHQGLKLISQDTLPNITS